MFGYFVLFCLFLAMLALCFFFGVLEWLRPKDNAPIPVDSAYVRDEFFLGTSFRNKMVKWMEKAKPLSSVDGNSPTESRILQKENGERILVVPAGNWGKRGSCEDLVYCLGDLHLPESATLHKEVYSLGSVHTDDEVRLQSLAGDRDIVLGARNHIARWVDASGSVRLLGGTVVQSRVTSRKEILLEPGASAGVLAAPLICTVGFDQALGQSASRAHPSNPCSCIDRQDRGSVRAEPITIGRYPVQHLDSDTWLIPGDLFLPAGSCIGKKIVVKGILRSATDCCFHGSVKANEIHLGIRNRVLGNVVSNSALTVGENTRIAGSVAAEKNIRLASGICIGAIEKPAAVSAGGSISLKRNVAVYGKLCAGQFAIAE